MKEFLLNTARVSTRVLIGADLPALNTLTAEERTLVIADQRLKQARPDWHSPFRTEWIEGGEETKTLKFVEQLYQIFLRHALDRESTVVAVGGGALSDVVGFATATFMRGIDLISVPTTFVCQVDACLGGKNGINYSEVKNLIGTIQPPKLVLCNPYWLQTLTPADFRQGISELIKHALIAAPDFLDFLSSNSQAILDRDLKCLEQTIFTSLQIKARFVEADECDHEIRHALNFGHTAGHALERHHNLPHGDAVALGMLLEIRLAERLGDLTPGIYDQVVKLLKQFGLPTHLEFKAEALKAYLERDKKGVGDSIKIPILSALGECGVRSVSKAEILRNLAW